MKDQNERFLNQTSVTSVNFPIETLIEGGKPVIVEGNGFEYRDLSKWMAFFRFFGFSTLWHKEQNHQFISKILLYK